jgi:hypothetical protein
MRRGRLGEAVPVGAVSEHDLILAATGTGGA